MENLGKTALVTGASRGIGRAIALMLASRGYAVALNYAGSREAAEAVKTEIENAGGKAFTIQEMFQSAKMSIVFSKRSRQNSAVSMFL